jgi:predicted lipid-binding transport protein (Tim44 family)
MTDVGKRIWVLVAVVAMIAMLVPDEAWARAGGGMSSGSRGSRSFSSPSRSYSAPSSSPSSQPFTQPRPATAPAPMAQPAPAGGFLRGIAGGVLGGLLGGMLFSSLGFAGGHGGGFGGGFGLMDLLLLVGIGYLIFWFIRRNRAVAEAPATGYYARTTTEPYGTGAAAATLEAPPASAEDLARGLGHVRQMDPRFDEAAFRESCTDLFFQIQGAWTRRDLERMRPFLTEEMQEAFGKQIEELKDKGQINKLENITVRSIEPTEAWQEQGKDYITVRFLANLLDYTVDEGSGKIVAGSDSVPVKFEEYWTWTRPVGPNAWRLGAINQAE